MLVDPLLILSTLATAAMGALLVYSATRGAAGDFAEPDTSYLERQVLYILVGLVVAVAAVFVPPQMIRKFFPAIFLMMLAGLLVVLQFGVEVNGTQAWLVLGLFRLQPSEPAKLVLIIGLAMILSPSSRVSALKSSVPAIVSLPRTLAALAMTLVPTALIMLQPDVGTTLLFRVWRTAQLAATPFDQLMSTGIFAMLVFQTFQSVGMTMGMMPVTGIPLPLVSYGGSSMLTTLVALGLVAGVYRRRLGIEGMTRTH